MTDDPLYRLASEDASEIGFPETSVMYAATSIYAAEERLRSQRTEGQLYRVACVGDLPESWLDQYRGPVRTPEDESLAWRTVSVHALYRAEWKKRGFQRSP